MSLWPPSKWVFAFVLFAVFSCSKIPQSKLQGDWFVDSIEARELTSDTDSGWKSLQGTMSIFVVGEVLAINKLDITPCPSAASFYKAYDNYTGRVSYTLSGGKMIIPDQLYYYAKNDGENAEYGEVAIQGGAFDIVLDGGNMMLSSTIEQSDNLGNIQKRTNFRISLHKMN